MSGPKPHDKRTCRNCHTEIEWASERPEEGWEYGWYHLPVIIGRRTGSKRCPIYAEPMDGSPVVSGSGGRGEAGSARQLAGPTAFPPANSG
jgi:hypothetical protein